MKINGAHFGSTYAKSGMMWRLTLLLCKCSIFFKGIKYIMMKDLTLTLVRAHPRFAGSSPDGGGGGGGGGRSERSKR